MINNIQSTLLSILFLLIVHSLSAVVLAQEFKSLEISKNRVVLNKVLPPSPSNLDRSVKIPMIFTVLPDGTVGEVIPLSKGDPSLEAISIKTLKKWKFNPIEDNIIMKGEITFTFSPEGGNNYNTNLNIVTPTINNSEKAENDKYYSVSHDSWGKFMNDHAVWINNKQNSNQGKITDLSFTFYLSEDKIYEVEVAGDDKATIIIDGEKLSIISNFYDREKINIFLKKGEHICSVQLLNISSSSSRWQDNPVGFGMVISDNGKTIITTRDREYVVKETPKYYPVSHPVWNDLLKNHAVWINNKENNHESEYKYLTFETIISKSGFYNFEISADDTAEFILDGNKIMDISYQKGIHNFKIKLEEGDHQLQMKVMNFTLYKSKWEENAVGAAILIKDNSGNIVFSTRDEKHCYKVMAAVKKSSEFNKQNFPDITIGNQVWMARNLDVDKFRNGDQIYEAKTPEAWEKAGREEKPAWCNYSFLKNDGNNNCKLYNWFAVSDKRGLAPAGWHIPTNEEWTSLKDQLDGIITSINAKTAEDPRNTTASASLDGRDSGINIHSFSTPLIGFCGFDGYFFKKDEADYWWSSSELDSKSAKYFSIENNGIIRNYHDLKSFGLSVRCINDSLSQQNNELSNTISTIPNRTNPNNLIHKNITLEEDNTKIGKKNIKDNVTKNSKTVAKVHSNSDVKIGKQIWMTKNLDVAKFRNGDVIPEARTKDEWREAGEKQLPAWCYYDNNPENGKIYGKLYNWYAVNDARGLAPIGYHIPSKNEWEKLVEFLVSDDPVMPEVIFKGKVIRNPLPQWNIKPLDHSGKKMKSKSAWEDYTVSYDKYFPGDNKVTVTGNGSNSSGFSGLPGGERSPDYLRFHWIGITGSWWSSTENITYMNHPQVRYPKYNAWSITLETNKSDVSIFDYNKNAGLSVRCIKD